MVESVFELEARSISSNCLVVCEDSGCVDQGVKQQRVHIHEEQHHLGSR